MKKTRSYISKLAAVVLVAYSLSSCTKDEYLNPVSQTSLSDVNAFDTKDRIVNQVAGIYSALKSGQLLGGRYFVYNDVRGENFLSNDGNRVTARAAWEFSETSGDNEVNNLWAAAYTTINRANLFLDGMAEKGDAIAGADAPKLNAEAKFVRAVAYYSLLQFYARPYWDGNGSKPGVPLRLVGIKGGGFNALKRSTVAEVYTQILADLDFAEQNLAATNGSAVLNVSRAHKNAAIAFKTRVHLSMRNYPAVVTEANKIVSANAPFSASSGVTHSLQADIANVFATAATTTESILSMPFTTVDVPGTQNQLGFYYLPIVTGANANGAGGIFYLNPNGIWGDATWGAADKRRTSLTTLNGGNQWLTKYKNPGPFLDWAPVIRYPEVLLSLAEALARTTNSVDARAVALLSAVRNRSDASVSYTTASFANVDALITAILKERNIEFLGEGIRSIDILRLGQDFPAKSIPGFNVTAVPPSSPLYIWPTPSDESRFNSLID
ncbi:MAG: RagB/SusD family nutrient uptake outer membrane protein [Chitinophagaceae bacterium]|nr:RagB/SusD family nutrient uptake outer membrane protein [Chitinophagaceae bacterium]